MGNESGCARQWGYTQICVARGIVSWGSEYGAAGELQLWYHESKNEYRIYTRKTAGGVLLEVKSKNINIFTYLLDTDGLHLCSENPSNWA